jgi:tetratricopeptide (TPR) repeat protein
MGEATLRPVCFMVMPFGTKVVLPRPDGAPEKIDFDALWHKALAPLIAEMGYEPVRADQDTGAAIILEMLERLYFSDLVVADMTLPNGNVYYEVGIRHACRPSGCLLVSADWATPLFDAHQMRRLVYPLPEGAISDDTALAIRTALRGAAPTLAEGRSPMYQHIPGFPDTSKVDPQRASAIRSQLDALSAFQARIRAVQLQRDQARQRADALALRDAHPAAAALSPAVAIEILVLLRDAAGWQDCIGYLDALPEGIRQLDLVQEQRSLALSKTGDHLQAIGALKELIRRRGNSAERHGLIGGRYKKLASESQKAGDAAAWRDFLEQAISHYEQGMQCDLNDYYPSCNLPRLYRARGDPDDARRASAATQVAMLACERAKARGSQDEWLNPTLLGLAFDAGDIGTARRLIADVRREGPAAWKLETTLADLERSVQQLADDGSRTAFSQLLETLRSIASLRH